MQNVVTKRRKRVCGQKLVGRRIDQKGKAAIALIPERDQHRAGTVLRIKLHRLGINTLLCQRVT